MQSTKLDTLCPYIREVGQQRMDAWHMPRRIYDHQFLYCFTGKAYIAMHGKEHRIVPGDLIVFPPDTPHRLWMDAGQPAELYWFHCDFYLYPDRYWIYDFYNDVERYITLFGSELQHKEHIRENPRFEGDKVLPDVMHLVGNDRVEYCFRGMYRAYAGGDPLWQLSARQYLYELMEIILRHGSADKGRNAQKAYMVNQMKAYIAKHYFEPLTVADICRDTGLNSEYASKLFRRLTGKRLVEYVNWVRINQAKKLLIDPGLSIVDIAEMVGFSNENYFCTVLKKMEGRTPAKMRDYLMALLAEE